MKSLIKSIYVPIALLAIFWNSLAQANTLLYSWYSPSREDNFATADPRWSGEVGDRRSPDYNLYRIEGELLAPSPYVSGTVMVYSWYSPSRDDNFLTTDPRWHGDTGDIKSPDYRFVRYEGRLYDPKRPQPANTVPVFSWYNASRGDNFATSDPKWSMPVENIVWSGEHIANGPKRKGYKLYRLEGFANPSGNELRAWVAGQHGADHSSAAVNIESQLGNSSGKLSMRDRDYRFRLHGVDSGSISTHYQGVGILRDVTVSSSDGNQRYRRAVLSYNYGPGLMVSSSPIDAGVVDGILDWETNGIVDFQGNKAYLDIIDEPGMGNHGHPGGLQSHGDLIAIAMEKPKTSHRAAVYFIRVDGLNPRFVTALHLGDGGAPAGLDLDAAAASGFIKLTEGYLVAVSGAKNGTDGIWFYKTSDENISSHTFWNFIDFWTPDHMPEDVCKIDDGKHSKNCYIGAGGGLSLLANDDGAIYLMATTGTDGLGKDDEFAQLYQVSIKQSNVPVEVNMRAVWSGKKKLGRLAVKHYSMRWAGAAQTTEGGRLILLNTERGRRKLGSRSASDGTLRIAQ